MLGLAVNPVRVMKFARAGHHSIQLRAIACARLRSTMADLSLRMKRSG